MSISTASSSLFEASNAAAQANAEIKAIVMEQKEAMNTITGEIEQVSGTISVIADSARETVDSAAKAKQVALSGKDNIQTMVSALNNLNSKIQHTGESVSTMSKETQQVHAILKFISEITEKTNLLALNAAIEAARAGEHGRGFDVVADEVRALANQTQSATVEIAEVIHNTQASVDTSLTGVKESIDCSATVVDIAHQAKQGLEAVYLSSTEIEKENRNLGEVSRIRSGTTISRATWLNQTV